MMRRKLLDYPLEKMPIYYTRIKEYFEMVMPHSPLACKAELGSSRSEKGYQIIAASACGRIARDLGANEDKAEALSMAVGHAFPKYGMAGMEAVKEYIIKNNIDLDLNMLGVELVEYIISRNMKVAEIFDKKLRQYFGGYDSDLEVRIVRFVQQTIKDVKIAEKYFNGHPGDLLFNVTQEIVELAKENGKLTPSKILDEYRIQIGNYQHPKLTEEQKQEVFTKLDHYIHVFCEKTGDRAKNNETPETAVLLYMYIEE